MLHDNKLNNLNQVLHFWNQGVKLPAEIYESRAFKRYIDCLLINPISTNQLKDLVPLT